MKATISKIRIKLLHWLIEGEMRRQGWRPYTESAGEFWTKLEFYEMAEKRVGSMNLTLTYHECASRVLKGLPR